MGNIEMKRVIPVLTIINDKLVKTVKFKNPNYIGDPINAVKIFNDKEVDEVILLDIRASAQKKEPNYNKIEEICSEAFMPFAYGGGIRNLNQVDQLFKLGIEKVILNSILQDDLDLIRKISNKYGEQSIVASIDVRKNLFGNYQMFSLSGKQRVNKSLDIFIKLILEAGIGELFVNSIDREGTYKGYDLELIRKVSEISDVPLIVNGGAKDIENLNQAIKYGASAVAASSLFVYRGVQKGILINYPSKNKLDSFLNN